MSKNTLINILPEEFPKDELSRAERELLPSVQEGKVLICNRPGPKKYDDSDAGPERAIEWSDDRTIRADFLRWLCVDSDAIKLIDLKGIDIRGAKITGRLDLACVKVSFPIGLFNCAIENGLTLRDATTSTFALSGSYTGKIFADRLCVLGSLFLRGGFHANGMVSLGGAKVGGDFSCRDGIFENKGSIALNAGSMSTEGSVYLIDNFHAKGEVRFPGAKIGGSFNCNNGTFENDGKRALAADGLVTKGSVLLSYNFHAKGEVRLVEATIGSSLDCSGGTFENDGKYALAADGLVTKGSVFLSNNFHAKGEVRLVEATIGSSLDCTGGTFSNTKGIAFAADNIEVKGAYFWCTKTRPVGEISLAHGQVGQMIDNKESWPDYGQLHIDGFKYGSLAGPITPKSATDRLDWLYRQFPLPSPAPPRTEPNQNVYPIKWLFKKVGNVVQLLLASWVITTIIAIFTDLPYGATKPIPKGEYLPQPFEQLAKVLRSMGHEMDARRIYIAKYEALRKNGDLKTRHKIWYWFLYTTIRYGWRPSRVIIIFMLPLLVFGGLLFCWADTLEIMTPTKLSHFKDTCANCIEGLPAGYPAFNSFVYAVDTFIPFLNLHQEIYWMPKPNKLWWEYIPLLFLWFYIPIGWVLSTLTAVSLSGLVRKE